MRGGGINNAIRSRNSLALNCLIIFGGPQVPQKPADYFKKFPFIDVAVRGEGEEAFSEVLERHLTSKDFSGIAGIAWRAPSGECVRNDAERPQSKDLDIYPSPYLQGHFEDLFNNKAKMDFQAIIETNRGCPFLCTFCFWGQGGLSRKYRFHSIERVKHEIQWCAEHKIRYVFNADSNFGMHVRDKEIAQILVDTKKTFGYPDKFRTCYGKNTDDKIYEIAMLLHSNELEKGITLARQSNDEEVLVNIKRQNIKMDTYKNLQIRFNEGNVPIYSELILGMPGENYQTWTAGIEEMLQSGIKNQIFIYQCQVFPNTDMADPEYQKKHGIVAQRVALTEIHGAIRNTGLLTEYEDIIIQTNAMSKEEWRKMTVFSWVLMVMHSLKLGFFVSMYLAHRYGVKYVDFLGYVSGLEMPADQANIWREEIAQYHAQADRYLRGDKRGIEFEEFGGIYWDMEEASFLRISKKLDQFYGEMQLIIESFLKSKNIAYDQDELEEALKYQRMRIPTAHRALVTEWVFKHNFPEFFEKGLGSNPVPLKKSPQVLKLVSPKDFQGDKPTYAKKTILWGRKSGTMLENVEWAIA